MNWRAGLTLVSFVVALALALFFSIQARADDQIPQLRKIYEDCVFRAVGSQAAANPKARFDGGDRIGLPSLSTRRAGYRSEPICRRRDGSDC